MQQFLMLVTQILQLY